VLISQIHERVPVTVRFNALPDHSFDAVVTEVGIATTGSATTFPVTVRLSRSSPGVRSGMAGSVAFRLEQGAGERIYLPPQAVGQDRLGSFVFILEASDEPDVGVVRRTAVEVAPSLTPDGMEALSGIQAGQRVVTAGVRRLSDGQRVRLLETEGVR